MICMYAQVWCEQSALGCIDILKQPIYVGHDQQTSELFVTKSHEVPTEYANDSVSLGVGIEQEVMPVFLDVTKIMLEAENKKAEALNMLRLRDMLR